jgi:hypothetical protein
MEHLAGASCSCALAVVARREGTPSAKHPSRKRAVGERIVNTTT